MDQVLENGVSVEGYMDVVQLHHQGSNCPLAGDLLVIPASYTLGRPGQLTTGTSRYLCAEFARAINIPYHVTVSVISQDNVPSMWSQLHCLVSWAIQYQPPETRAFFQPRHWQEINRQKQGLEDVFEDPWTHSMLFPACHRLVQQVKRSWRQQGLKPPQQVPWSPVRASQCQIISRGIYPSGTWPVRGDVRPHTGRGIHLEINRVEWMAVVPPGGGAQVRYWTQVWL